MEYEKFSIRDRQSEIDKIIDWEVLRQVIKDLFKSGTEKGEDKILIRL